jgi:hypothetical protein
MGRPTFTHLNPLAPILEICGVLCQRREQVFLFTAQRLTRVAKSGMQFSRSFLLNPALGAKSSKRGELTCKPGSVEGNHSSTNCVTAALQQPTRKHAGLTLAPSALRPPALLPYLALLQAGFSSRRVLPPTRCALTAPFHPCRHPCGCLGGLFSVALSVGSRPPGVTWRLVHWSPDFPPRFTLADVTQRLPSQLPRGGP